MKHDLNLYNPAEFFASLGILTILSLQHPESEIRSHFVISGHRGELNSTFVLGGDAEFYLESILDDLVKATLTEDKTTNVWRNSNENPRLISPVVLSTSAWSITLDWWLDELRWRPSDLKLWSGNSTPLDMIRSFTKLGIGFVNAGGTVFGFDTRANRDSLAVGYSKKDTAEKAGLYPSTELLCAIGVQHYRPHNRTYFAWREPIPINVTHAAAIQEIPGLRQSKFEFAIQKIGQGARQAIPLVQTFAAATAS